MISLPAAIFWVTYIWNPGGAISPSWADTQWAVNSSDSSHSTESTLSNTKVEEGTTIQTFSSACKFGKCFQYRIAERMRLEATTVGHLVPTPCSSKIIPEHMAQACIWMVLEYLWVGLHTLFGQSVSLHRKVLHIQVEQNTAASTQAEVWGRKHCSTTSCKVACTTAPFYQDYTTK